MLDTKKTFAALAAAALMSATSFAGMAVAQTSPCGVGTGSECPPDNSEPETPEMMSVPGLGDPSGTVDVEVPEEEDTPEPPENPIGGSPQPPANG